MVDGGDRTDFAEALAALARDAIAEISGPPAGPWRVSAAAEGGFALDVHVADDEIGVTIGGWVYRDSLGEPEVWDEALDLVAAALGGRISVVETWAGGRCWRGEVVFEGATGPRTIGRWGGTWLGWRPGLRRAVRRNVGAAAVASSPGGASPVRPWVGVRGQDTAAGAKALVVDGELDLHPFSPKEVKPLVLEYIDACVEAGIDELRIVHGKGIGNLRRTVHALLSQHDRVASFRLGGHGAGGWGATLVTLRPKAD
jgi:hypothetical protein